MTSATGNTTIARFALGVAALTVICGTLTYATVLIRRRALPDWTGAPARLAESVIGLGLLITTFELLGTIGFYRLGPITAACCIIGLGTRHWAGRPQGARPRGDRPDAPTQTNLQRAGACELRPPRTPAKPPPNRLPIAIALLAGAAVTAEWASVTFESYDVGIRTFDSLWYHLPWAASFAQTGHVASLRFTDVEYLTSFYPATSELLHGLGIVLFARDTLSPGINLLWLWLTLLAAYCVGRPRGLGAWSALGAALALATPMMTASQAGSAANDIVGVFFLMAAVALLMNGGGRRGAVALAAVAAGLAVGVKLSLLAPVLALTLGVLAIAPRGRREATTALWLGPLLIAGGFWYLRNLIAVGNPLPWTSLAILPTPSAPLQQHTAFSVAHYLGDTRIYSRVLEPGLAAGLGPWWVVIVAGAVIGPLLCLLLGRDRPLRLLGFVALASLAAYLVTPETAAGPAGDPIGFGFNLRYAAPALVLSLAVLPLAPGLSGACGRWVTLAGLLLVLAATLAQARLWPGAHLPAAIGAGVVAALVGLLLGPLRDRLRAIRQRDPSAELPPPPGLARARLVWLLTAAAALLFAASTAGYAWQEHYLRGRYAFHPGVSYMARIWTLFRGVHHARVGLAGTFGGFFSYPLYGLDDSNSVQYLAHRGRHGSFTVITACPAWREAVNAAHLQYLVTAPARDPWHPKALTRSPENAWTASDPAAHVIYTRRALGQPLSVYALRGALNPATCP